MEEERRARLVQNIKFKLLNLCQHDMCIIMMAYQFMVYLHIVNLLRSRLTTGVESLIGTMFTYYAMRVKSCNEDMMFQDAPNVEA